MRPRSLLALTLAASLSMPALAGEGKFGLSDTLLLSGVSVVVLPLYLLSGAGVILSQEMSSRMMEKNKRWEVSKVAPQGETTALELRSEDKALKIEMTVATATARTRGLQVRDQLDIEPIGRAGYAVNKGPATIGVLAQPDSGMVHSAPRN